MAKGVNRHPRPAWPAFPKRATFLPRPLQPWTFGKRVPKSGVNRTHNWVGPIINRTNHTGDLGDLGDLGDGLLQLSC